jgi:hypothetical protein|nr:MAG TPA: Protein of unknown function (DUF1018) [Caudoviricetes sp.]
MNQSEYRKRLLTLIHINPLYKQIVENEAWQEWLMLRFGVESSKELSISELNLALDILQERVDDRLGFEPDIKGRRIFKKDAITQKQLKKIEVLLDVLGWDDNSARRFYYRQIGALVTNIALLNSKQATKIITGLNAVIKCEKNPKKS